MAINLDLCDLSCWIELVSGVPFPQPNPLEPSSAFGRIPRALQFPEKSEIGTFNVLLLSKWNVRHYISNSGDERYPNIHWKYTKIPTLSSVEAQEDGKSLLLPTLDHSQGLWFFSRPSPVTGVSKQWLLSEQKHPQFCASSCVGFPFLLSFLSLFLLLFMKGFS